MARRSRPIQLDGMNIFDAFSGMRSDYDAAKNSRFRRKRTGVNSYGSGSDYHYRNESDYLRMIEFARDLDRNDVVVGQGISRVISNVIQDGMSVDPDTGDRNVNDDLKARWSEWANDPNMCDSSGEKTFAGIEQLALRSRIVDGDCWFLALNSGQLQPIEAHRVRTPNSTKRNVVHGVLLDNDRRRIECWLTKDDISPLQALRKVSDIVRYPIRDEDGERVVFQVYDPKRFSQTRGITALAPIADMVGMHDDIQFANLVRQQVVSCFTIIRTREATPVLPATGDDTQYGERTTDTRSDGSTRTVEGISPGMEIKGDPGENIVGFSPNIPGEGFINHAQLILTFIAVNLDLPLAVLLLDPTKTNFSGWRGAIDQARKSFKMIQSSIITQLHIPTYRWKVRQWLAEDSALRSAAKKSGVNIFRHKWNRPTWEYIEPTKDATADILRLKNVLTSPRRLHSGRGLDWEEIVSETIDDNAIAIRSAKKEAIKINKDFNDDDPVHWRELISLPAPDGLSIIVGGQQNQSNGGNQNANQ